MSPASKKSLTGAAVAGVAALALAGCSSTGGASSADSDTVVVSMWASGEAETASLEAQLDIAREQNPDLEIELRTSPWADYFTKLTTDLASGNAACVVGMNSSMFPGYVEGFRALSDEDLEAASIDLGDFGEGASELLSMGGELYGMPLDLSTMILYTNQDVLGAAGVEIPADGWTFDEFRDAAAAATKDGKHGFSVGISTSSWQAIPISVSGTQPVDEQGELDLTNADFTDAATAYAELVTVDHSSPEFPSAAETNFAQDQYLAGNIGMVVDGSWNALKYLENESGFAAGLTTLPGDASGTPLGMALGSGYGLSQSCENPDAALRVFGSLLSAESLDSGASSGRAFPSRVASQPLYFESLPEEHRAAVQATFERAFANVEGQRVTEDWAKIGSYIQPNLIDVYTGRAPIADVLETAQSQFGN